MNGGLADLSRSRSEEHGQMLESFKELYCTIDLALCALKGS